MTADHADAVSERTVRIGLLGSGNVGAAVIRLLHDHAEDVARKAGARLEVARVAVRDPDRDRGLSLPPDMFTNDPGVVVDDPAIDIVCELMGGVEDDRRLVQDEAQSGSEGAAGGGGMRSAGMGLLRAAGGGRTRAK